MLFWVVLQINSMRMTSVTYDEPEHVEFGMRILTGNAVEASMQKMPITALNAVPLLIARKAEWVPDLLRMTVWNMARLPTLFMGAAILLFVLFWSHSLFGRQGAFVSFLAAVFCPNLAAHAGLATTDIPFSLALLAALYALCKFSQDRTWLSLGGAAFITGVAQLTKSSALLLIPLGCCLIACVDFRLNFRRDLSYTGARIAGAAAGIVLFVAIVLLSINIGYGFRNTLEPFSVYRDYYQQQMAGMNSLPNNAPQLSGILSSVPVPLPHVFVETVLVGIKYNKSGEGHGPIYLLGKLDREGFWYYFPVIFLLKVPLPLIILICCAAFAVFRRKHKTGMFLVAFSGLYFLLFTAGCSAQIGFRYLLPIMPLLYVVMGILPQVSVGYGRAAQWGMGVAFGWLIVSTLSYYPHWLAYMNEVVIDRKRSYLYCADSNLDWGQNDLYLKDYLLRHPSAQVEPQTPVRGEVILSVNNYLGLNDNSRQFNWISKNYKPVDTFVYSWLIFSIP